MIPHLVKQRTSPDGDGLPSRVRWLPPVAWAVAALAGFAVYLRLADTRAVNSDGASQALQAWDLLHGNLLLSGWRFTDVAFYTTEIPQYALIEAVRGLGAGVAHIAAAMTYTLVVLLAAALAKGTATGREAVLRVVMAAGIMLAPQLVTGTDVLVSSPDHTGTSVLVLVAWLVLDRCEPRWWVPVVTTVLLAWSMIGDELVLVVAIVPLVGVCALRLLRKDRSWFEAALAGGGIAAAVIGMAAPHVIQALGGYDVPAVSTALSPMGHIIQHNVPVAGQGFLLLGGAYFSGLPAGAQFWFALLHLAGVALAAAGIAVTAWRFFRGESLVPQLLLAGVVVNVAAYVLGTHAALVNNAREMAPVLAFAAVLAGRQLPRLLLARAPVRRVAVPVLGLVLAGYAAGLALELTTPTAPPQNAQLTAWLTRHPMGGTGLSGYWEANVVTLTSAGQAAVRPVDVTGGGRLARHQANTKAEWFDPARSYADFVVLGPPVPGFPGFADHGAAVATFGAADRVYRFGRYTILWWHKNILADLAR